MILNATIITVTKIGVEFQSLTVSEEVESGEVEVCVVMFSVQLPCTLSFFDINVYTNPISASEASSALFYTR